MLTTKAAVQACMERSLEQPLGLRDLILQVHGMQTSPQVQCIEGCLHRRPETYLFKSPHPWLWKGSHASLGGHRRRLTSFQLCVVWLQCASGIQNSLLPQCGPAQIHLCPEAQPYGTTGVQNLELPPALATESCIFAQLMCVGFLPHAGHAKRQRCTSWGVSTTGGSQVHKPRCQKVFFSIRMQELSGQDRSSWSSWKSERGKDGTFLSF